MLRPQMLLLRFLPQVSFSPSPPLPPLLARALGSNADGMSWRCHVELPRTETVCKMAADMEALLQDASPWGKHAPVYKLSAAAKETSMDALGEEDEEWDQDSPLDAPDSDPPPDGQQTDRTTEEELERRREQQVMISSRPTTSHSAARVVGEDGGGGVDE